MKIRALPNLGPKSETMLAQIGVKSTEQFLESNVFELYQALLNVDTTLSLNMLYAMIGAQENIPWQQVAKQRKTEILMRLDDMGLAK